jgi:hypothetical protein
MVTNNSDTLPVMNFQFATGVFDCPIAVFSKLIINSASDPMFISAAD